MLGRKVRFKKVLTNLIFNIGWVVNPEFDETRGFNFLTTQGDYITVLRSFDCVLDQVGQDLA